MRQLISTGLLLAASPIALAQLEYGNNPPVAHGVVEFAEDFPELMDSEWDFPIGGFGGTRRGEAPNHPPVIFVHGNNVDACDWKLVRDDFRAAGWSDQALWALSYNGLGNDVGNSNVRPDQRCKDEHAERNGGDSVSRITANDVNVPDLYAFIMAVRGYTGSNKFSLVSHSLGVTVARKTLKVYPELRDDLVAFVGIAGGNHGTSLCPPGSAGQVHGCDELTPGSEWLADLNGPDGDDETYPPAQWLTIYEGTGAGDTAYLPPDHKSPRLEGADNREYPATGHNVLRIDPAIVAEYRTFIEDAEMMLTFDSPVGTNQGSGGGTLSLSLLMLLAARRLTRMGRNLLLSLGLIAISQTALAAQAAPAAQEFPADFKAPLDSELGSPLGGFGAQAANSAELPLVIFVHGNTSDACDWKLVRDDFIKAGWNAASLWALSYHGLGSGKSLAPARPDQRCVESQTGNAGMAQITSNEVNVADLYGFIQAVRAYSGQSRFSLIGHSLGVTLARRTLQAHPKLRNDLITFVGIAGGNDGTSLCPPGSEKVFPGCAEFQPGSAWVQALNGPDGSEETYPPARWMTIYDGGGKADIAFVGELASSPELKGADNRAFPGTSHNDLRVRQDIVAIYRQFIEDAIKATDARDRRWRLLIGK